MDQQEDQDGITAYHGSPHDFERFDISKIGTGEGAQAYGHGLYFAGAEPVAQTYRGDPEERYRRVSGHMDPKEEYAFDLASHSGDVRDFDVMMGLAKKYGENIDFEEAEKLARNAVSKRGHMYEVHIAAHPDHFLDWDKPLSEQPEHIQNLARSIEIPNERYKTPLMLKAYQEGRDVGAPATGMTLHDVISTNMGDDPKKAAEFLHKNGVKGIKYLDRDSRAKGVGTTNYVVFDDKLVSTKRKYARGGKVNEYPLAENDEDHLTYMSPDEFLDRARPLKDTEENKETVGIFKKGMEKGHKLDPLALYPDNQENGRHRAEAAKQLGIKKVPVHDYRKWKKKGGVVDHALMVISCQPKGSGDAR